jgi:hypothetical protein
VTGGGLPAEIWHETMIRVTDGMTPQPLPMMPPIPPTRPVRSEAAEKRDPIGGILNQVLKDILGGGR